MEWYEGSPENGFIDGFFTGLYWPDKWKHQPGGPWISSKRPISKEVHARWMAGWDAGNKLKLSGEVGVIERLITSFASRKLRIDGREIICGNCGHDPHSDNDCGHMNHGNALPCQCYDFIPQEVEKGSCGMPPEKACRNFAMGSECTTHPRRK